MAAVESERKWRLVLQLLYVFEVCISVYAVVSSSDTESEIVELVRRRQKGDFYHFINSTTDNCGNENSTYLISENQCLKDEELFRGKLI